MAKRLRVGVIFGGRSGEHEVSLVSASFVIQSLDREKYEIVPIGIAPDGRWLSSTHALNLLKEKKSLDHETERFLVPEPNRQALISANGETESPLRVDVIFPLVHGTYGEDGTLQGLLELADLPYVGAGVLASAVGMDKIVQKQLLRQAGLRVAKYSWFLSGECRQRPERVAALAEKELRYPLFVKPANTGSSVGISKAHNRNELLRGLLVAVEFDRKIIVEQGVRNAQEIECSVLGNDEPIASMPGEIVSSNEFYDYDAKYVDGKSAAIIPARLPKTTIREIQRQALLAYRTLDCSGMARADFFVTGKSHRIYVNELNTIPGFTAISMYAKLWQASGISVKDLLDRLIELAIQRHAEKGVLKREYHPLKEWYKT